MGAMGSRGQRGARGMAAISLGLALAATNACGPADGCTAVDGASFLRIQVPPAIQKLTATLRVELCQGERCASVNFPSRSGPDSAVIPGVALEKDTYVVDVDLLGTGWAADSPSGLTVLGTTEEGPTVLRHTEQFAFDGYYPNGADCDRFPSVTYSTSVSADDLVS